MSLSTESCSIPSESLLENKNLAASGTNYMTISHVSVHFPEEEQKSKSHWFEAVHKKTPKANQQKT